MQRCNDIKAKERGSRKRDADMDLGLNSVSLRTFEFINVSTNGVDFDDLKIQDLSAIGSYSISSGPSPTIIVPGSPDIWTEPSLPFRIKRDNKKTYKKLDNMRLPKHQLLSAIISCRICTPTFNWPSVDFFTERSTLRKLLRWSTSGKGKDFRIDIQMAGEKTMIFERWEEGNLYRNSGFGRNFERFTTTPSEGCEGGVVHHRVALYKFGGIQILQIFEVDACLPAAQLGLGTLNTVAAHLNFEAKADSSGMSSSTRFESNITIIDDITVIKKGSLVSQESIIELKTVTLKKHSINWMETYPQLYLSQTSKLYTGLHNEGRFEEVRKQNLSDPDLVERGEKLQDSFAKLSIILKQLQEAVLELGARKKLSLVHKDGRLALYERTNGRNALPQKWLKIFDKDFEFDNHI